MLVGLGILALLALLIVTKSFKIVGQAEVLVIERLGRFNRLARSGFNILIPFIERPRPIDVRYFESDVNGVKKITSGSTSRIDLREQVLNFPSQPVITKDNVTIDIDAVLYYRIADPQKATYSIQNLPYAIEPPRDIQQSMELVMRAERERRAAVTNAEASKRAAILESEGLREAQVRKAEGEKEAAVLRAQGLAEARLAMANAEADAIQRIASSLPDGQAAMYLLGLKYLEALPHVAQGKGSTIFLPAEATGVLGALGGMRELLSRAGGTAQESGKAPPQSPSYQ